MPHIPTGNVRSSRKRALCIGCNYPASASPLYGACADAFLTAHTLQSLFDFPVENICVLYDEHPNIGPHTPVPSDPARIPTRINMLKALGWLVHEAQTGDVLFFSFSGKSCQVDDLDGYEGEGLSSAILPSDCLSEMNHEATRVVPTRDIRDVLQSVPFGVVLHLLMDTTYATDLVDVTGVSDGRPLVAGLKWNTACGLSLPWNLFNDHTGKYDRATPNDACWTSQESIQVGARPKHNGSTVLEVDLSALRRAPNTRECTAFMRRPHSIAFCLSASDHGQTALEMILSNHPIDTDAANILAPSQRSSHHGLLTWSWWRAVQSLVKTGQRRPTVADVHKRINEVIEVAKAKHCPKCDQKCILTYAKPFSAPSDSTYC